MITKIDGKHVIDNIVVQDNVLVQSCYQMSVNEKKLLALGMSKLNPMELPAMIAGGEVVIEVSVEEWVAAFGDKNPYASMRDAADRLLGRNWRTDDPKIKGPYTKVNWFDSCYYDRARGVVRLLFCRHTSLFLQGMVDEFTKYRIGDIAQLGSFNQIRLYEMLCQFSETGFLTIGLDELKTRLCLERSYPRWVDFDRHVIKPSLAAINKSAGLGVTYKTVKTQRKVTRVEFFFPPVKRVTDE